MRIVRLAGVPAGGDEFADLRGLRRLGVEMERLRVPFAGEFDDLFRRHERVAERKNLADGEILEIQQVQDRLADAAVSGRLSFAD